MSLIDVACRTVLAADSGVTTLVSTRLYPHWLPEDATLPAISYSLISDVPDPDVRGDRKARVQISCWSDPAEQAGIKSPAEVDSVAEAVISALNRTTLQKTIRAWSVGSTTYIVLACKCSNAPRLYEKDTEYYHVPCDFVIKYRT